MIPAVYLFEEIADDLPRPPMAALRALLEAGLVVSPRGWRKLPLENRQALATLGLRDVIDREDVRRALAGVPLGDLKMVPTHVEPPGDILPDSVERAAGAVRPLTGDEWRQLRPLDRFVLRTLAPNARLFGRAFEEVLKRRGVIAPQAALVPTLVAHVEVQVGRAIARLWDPSFLDGRGLVLARVAGVRAARMMTDVFDLHADNGVGVVELAASPKADHGIVLWQAHVSLWDGSFSATASLSAATTAAVSVLDMLRDVQPTALITVAMVRVEPWEASPMFQDEATIIYQTLPTCPSSPASPGSIPSPPRSLPRRLRRPSARWRPSRRRAPPSPGASTSSATASPASWRRTRERS